MPAHERLSADSLTRERPALAPGYDRSATPTVLHVGVGSFARAHLAVYADELSRHGTPTLVRGVSLRSRGAEDRLAPQDGLFTVLEREIDRQPSVQVVGSLVSVATGWRRAVGAISQPTTSLVSLTVTEKGYELEPDDLDPRADPSSAPAVVARGLLARPADAPVVVVASLDNLLDNGRVLGDAVRRVVEAVAPDRLTWLDEAVRFPSSVVDRIVPATTPDDEEEAARLLGLDDRAVVVAEHHRSWVIEAVDGLPPLGDIGVTMVDDIEPWQRRKLWLLNGPHSALAYAGLVAGADDIADAASAPLVARFVERYVDHVLGVADLGPALAAPAFAHDAVRRFRNPALRHRCSQVGADGSRKLPQRVHPVIDRLADRSQPTERASTVIAMWLVAVAGLPVRGQPLEPVDDPRRTELRALAGDHSRLCDAVLVDVPDVVRAEVVHAVDAICARGVHALEELS